MQSLGFALEREDILSPGKKEHVYGSYAVEKSHIGEADLAAILRDIQKRHPGSIRELVGFEEYDENGIWRPEC